MSILEQGRLRAIMMEYKNIIRTIGDGAFIGSDTMLVAPVTVGEHAQTGAGTVVIKDVPPGALVVGVPARVLRMPQMPQPAEGSTAEGSKKE